MARLTLDANILVYAATQRDHRAAAARHIIARAAHADCILTVQALGEFLAVATRRRVVPLDDAQRLLDRWRQVFGEPVPHHADGLALAFEAAAAGRFQFWDAMFLATAGAAGCTALITEDMTPGDSLAGVTIIPAFAGDAISPEAAALLG